MNKNWLFFVIYPHFVRQPSKIVDAECRKNPTKWCPVKLDEVRPMLTGHCVPLATADEKKTRAVLIRLDDVLLHDMWLEIELQGKVDASNGKCRWRLAGSERGRVASGMSANRRMEPNSFDSQGLLLHKDGVCITVEIARALDLLYTMRLGL